MSMVVAPMAAAQETRAGLGAADLFALAERAVNDDRPVDALAIYAALGHDSDREVRAEARFRQGMLLGALKRYRDAATVFRAFLDEKPGTPRVELELARDWRRWATKRARGGRCVRRRRAGCPPMSRWSSINSPARCTRRNGSAARWRSPSRPTATSTEPPVRAMLDTVIAPLTLSRDAREQSGLGVKASGQAYMRVALSAALALLPRLSGSASLYRASDFDDVSGSALVGLEWRLGRDRLTPAVGPTWRWYGGRLYARTDTAAIDWLHPIGRRTQLTVSGSAAHASYRFNPLQSGGLYDLSVGVEHALTATGGIGGTVGTTRQSARDPGYATIAGYASVYGWRDIGRTTLFASAALRHTEGDARLALFPDRRHEWLYQFAGGATFRRLTFHGFAPIARIVAERNVSSIGLYDYRRVAGDIGIARAF